MSRTFAIEVTQYDIDAGRQGDCGCCPIALAVMRCRNTDWARIGTGHARWNDGETNRREYGDLPPEAAEFVAKFDKFSPDAVKPMTFVISKE